MQLKKKVDRKMNYDKEKIIEQEMRALAKKVDDEEVSEEKNKEVVNSKGNVEKGKLPISPTRMSSNQARNAQVKFTEVVRSIDDDLMSEGWAVVDGRGKRVAGRSFVMSCLTDLMIAACEPANDSSSEYRQELESFRKTATKYIKERRRVRDFYPKK